ncbi:MAG: 2-oxoacid:acceptor oxidoreductase family protein [Candidatus Omnitrophica bacterium]|nr:2-oxoacid:acceptor oxidoreductase family protein [Candidatus Omnitrophota bacterium]
MKEIIIYGRGGQGAVVASRLLAIAAFKEGRYVQSFPFFGVERRGAPVAAYTRISDTTIRKRTPINEPDYVIILDPTLIESIDITKGLKKGGGIIINTRSPKTSFKFGKNFNACVFDAAKIAIKHKLGSESAPIVNTAILGTFSKFTNEVGISALLESIKENVSTKTKDNIDAAKEAYENTIS